MADLKISQLPEATSPLLTDIVPIVNEETTKKTSIQKILSMGYLGNDVRALTAKYDTASTLVEDNANNWNQAYDISTAYSLISSTFLTSGLTGTQELTFDNNTKNLSIENGNTVSLSALIAASIASNVFPEPAGPVAKIMNLFGSVREFMYVSWLRVLGSKVT